MLIDSVYGMAPPDKKLLKLREMKVKEIIANMGDRYLLSKPVNKSEPLPNLLCSYEIGASYGTRNA